jgi:hypothetical protein
MISLQEEKMRAEVEELEHAGTPKTMHAWWSKRAPPTTTLQKTILHFKLRNDW